MWIVCQADIKYQVLFLLWKKNIFKMSAAVVIGTLRVNSAKGLVDYIVSKKCKENKK